MLHLAVLGNAGSGKSTLARKLAQRLGLAHLDLDMVAWQPEPPPRRLTTEASIAKIRAFTDAAQGRGEGWVIEGCYGDLIAGALALVPDARLIFLNPGVDGCVANCRARPWEPHKYPTREAQDANLAMLIDWVQQYTIRDDDLGFAGHSQVFDGWNGRKREYTENTTIETVLADLNTLDSASSQAAFREDSPQPQNLSAGKIVGFLALVCGILLAAYGFMSMVDARYALPQVATAPSPTQMTTPTLVVQSTLPEVGPPGFYTADMGRQIAARQLGMTAAEYDEFIHPRQHTTIPSPITIPPHIPNPAPARVQMHHSWSSTAATLFLVVVLSVLIVLVAAIVKTSPTFDDMAANRAIVEQESYVEQRAGDDVSPAPPSVHATPDARVMVAANDLLTFDERLRRLNSLHWDGILSDAEFERAKTKILKEM